MSERPGNSLDEWYPLVRDLVDTPRTEIVYAGADLAPLLYAGDEDAPDVGPELSALVTDIECAADKVGGFPIFLRTGLMSGKHDWVRTCFVPNPEAIRSHVYAIVEYSELADVFGGRPTDVWVVREFLKTQSPFTAFEGMPVTRERRYFVVDGEVVGHHPYWPPDVFTEIFEERPELEGKLELLNADLDSDVITLTAMTMKVGEVLPGAWSVDWFWVDDRGWVLTDMAHAEESYVWWEHPDAPKAGAW